MTTIAWDGKTLAADRCSWSGGSRRAVRKVHKVQAPDGRRFLVGFCGDGAFALAALDWLKGQGEKPQHQNFGVDPSNQFAIVIDENSRVWNLTANMTYIPYAEQIMAMGGWSRVRMGSTGSWRNSKAGYRNCDQAQ